MTTMTPPQNNRPGTHGRGRVVMETRENLRVGWLRLLRVGWLRLLRVGWLRLMRVGGLRLIFQMGA